MTSHRETILDQFTRQALPFATAPSIQDAAALRLVVEFSGAGPDDLVLDVACGPGIVACAFAEVVKHVAGLDLTPAMLDRARMLQREKGLTNVSWQLGEAIPLPYPDECFSIVTSRFAFHHLLEPTAALREMKRVCRRDGRVMVIDSAPAPDKADAFNTMERLRDPSHLRAMPLGELRDLFRRVGLGAPRTTSYRLEGELESLIKRSFPNPGDDETLRRIFRASLEDDALGIETRRDGETIRFGYPVAVLVADRR